MQGIYELRVEYGEDGKAEVTAVGNTNQGNEATCKVIARLGTSYQFTLISFIVSEEEAAVVEDTTNDQQDEVTDTEAVDTEEEETNDDITDTEALDDEA
jgi:hypothetical protein